MLLSVSVSVISHIGKIFKLLPIFTCMHVSAPLILLFIVYANVPRVIRDYFSISEDSDKFASCTVCKDRVSRGGSCVKNFDTTNLIDHLKKKHPGDYEGKKKIRELKEKEKQKEQTAPSG